jgi:ankyrin repeat protein
VSWRIQAFAFACALACLFATHAGAQPRLSLPVPTLSEHAADPALRRLATAALLNDQPDLKKLLVAPRMMSLSNVDKGELLSMLIVNGNVDAVTQAVRAGISPDLVLDTAHEGQRVRMTALNFAIGSSPAVAQRLLALGASASKSSIDDNPPVVTAAAVREHGLLGVLLESGADPNASDSVFGLTPLMLVLAKEPEADQALQSARMLAGHGARLDAASITGHTALMLAAQAGHVFAVQWLLQKGADCNPIADRGETALSMAQRSAAANASEVLAALRGCARPLESLVQQ